MLMGTYHHNLDDKGRVNFPAKLRESLGDKFFVTRGVDGCLFVYPYDEWMKFTNKINALPMSKGKDLQRFFFAGAGEVEPDKQGRIIIPAHLRAHANLEKELVIVGAADRAEIWNLTLWQANNQEMDDKAILEMMDEIGF